eukprot:GHUV01025608.1.p1 GENE.GHUV01025608.1~~GHUV01025608.1.p1  ORF type:complete len:191 (+),score=34.13 GHUV01025608.1:491-1063(+)
MDHTLRTEADIQKWFNRADFDHSGTLSKREFVVMYVGLLADKAKLGAGGLASAVCAALDADGDGKIGSSKDLVLKPGLVSIAPTLQRSSAANPMYARAACQQAAASMLRSVDQLLKMITPRLLQPCCEVSSIQLNFASPFTTSSAQVLKYRTPCCVLLYDSHCGIFLLFRGNVSRQDVLSIHTQPTVLKS